MLYVGAVTTHTVLKNDLCWFLYCRPSRMEKSLRFSMGAARDMLILNSASSNPLVLLMIVLHGFAERRLEKVWRCAARVRSWCHKELWKILHEAPASTARGGHATNHASILHCVLLTDKAFAEAVDL